MLIVDSCPDANGFWTIRVADGTPHGDLTVQPIATVYDRYNADRIVETFNKLNRERQ